MMCCEAESQRWANRGDIAEDTDNGRFSKKFDDPVKGSKVGSGRGDDGRRRRSEWIRASSGKQRRCVCCWKRGTIDAAESTICQSEQRAI